MSIAIRFHAALVVLVSLWLSVVSATSAPSRPLKRVVHPTTYALEIFPRQPSASKDFSSRSRRSLDSTVLQHSDSFRLTLSAFDDTFHLHLRPNDHLIHPSARINYYSNAPDGSTVLLRTEPLLRESVKAYWGEVISAAHSPDRMREDAAGLHPSHSRVPELGWARIMVHHQGDVEKNIPPVFEGAFSINGVTHHVMTKENYLRNKHIADPDIISDDPDSALIVFRDSDMMTVAEEEAVKQGVPIESLQPTDESRQPHTCAHDSLPFNTDPYLNPLLRKPVQSNWYDPYGLFDRFPKADNFSSFEKRDDVAGGGSSSNFVNSIGQINGCPTTQKIVYMGVAADCQYTTRYGSTQNASMQILNDWNMATSIYKQTFNVSLGIIHIDMHDSTCPNPPDQTRPWNTDCTDSVTLNDRLSLFSQWRGTLGDDGTGLWHLMSGCPTGTEVGVAWLGTLCQQSATGNSPSVVSGTAVSTNGRTEWQVIAHEIGHNFGAVHDCTDGCTISSSSSTPCCPLTSSTCDANDQFIMSPVTDSKQSAFSQCSLGNICSLMLKSTQGSTNTQCLQDPDPAKQTITLQMCGNGIVEAGEDCDPGLGVTSPCCNSQTCKFASNALCDPASSPCCTNQCQFAPSTQVCRPSANPTCDTAETCTGTSSACPPDKFAQNGLSCGANGLACANGLCTSVSQQCQNVGASMNLTKACPNRDIQTCQVSCQDPTNANACVQLQSQLVDGSPCGFGGTCVGGNCRAGSILDTAKAWYTSNLQISIPVTVVVGIVAIMLIWALIVSIRRFCCGKRKKIVPVPVLEPAFQDSRTRGQRIPSLEGAPRPRPNEPPPPPVSFPPPAAPVLPMPTFLQPGSEEGFWRAPPSVTGNADSGASSSQRSSRNLLQPPFPTAPRGRNSPRSERTRWVDPTPWNGPTSN